MIPTRMNPMGRNPYKQKISYLQGSGTTYIDTGISLPASPFRIECSADISALAEAPSSDYQSVFGAQYLESPVAWQWNPVFGVIPGGAVFMYIGDQYVRVFTSGSIPSGRKDFVLAFTGSSASFLADNVQIASMSNVTMRQIQLNIHLFCANYRGNPQQFSQVRIYSWKCAINGQTVRHMIPVLDENNVPCMFDNVTRKLFYNAGTGAFTYE